MNCVSEGNGIPPVAQGTAGQYLSLPVRPSHLCHGI